MTRKRILAMIIALSTLAFLGSGCHTAAMDNGEEKGGSEGQNLFEVITNDTIGNYQQTIIYDVEELTEYVYLWHKGSGRTASTVLYLPDGTPKTYSGEACKLILVSSEEFSNYTLSVMYDSETSVMYASSWNSNEGDITIQLLYHADGTPKLYRNSEGVP